MPESGHYVRIRGKVSGPFDVPALQKLVRRGALSKMHEVSADRRSWAPAGEFEELFPVTPSVVADRAEQEVERCDLPDDQPAHAPAVSGSYFYVQNGVTVGPVPLTVLQSLAQNGTLGPRDVCWSDGAQLAGVAGQLPALAQIFSSGRSPNRGRNVTPPRFAGSQKNGLQRGSAAIDSAAIDSASKMVGVTVSALLIILLNLPIGVFHDHTVWWWNTLSEPGNSTVVIVLFFVLFSGLVVGPIATISGGLVRSWFFVAIAALSFTLFLALGLSSSSDGSYFFMLVVPYAAAALFGIAIFRSSQPESRAAAIFQGVLGGILLFAIIVLGVFLLATNTRGTVHQWTGDQVPGWVVLSLVLTMIAGIAGGAGGVLGLLGLRRKLLPAVNGATIGCCLATIVLPLIAILIMAGGCAEFFMPDQRGMAIFLCSRICVGFAGYLALMATGMTELFAAYSADAE